MQPLRDCPHCEGFLPPRTRVCPHCGKAIGREIVRRIGRSIFCAAGGGAVAITLMACYGAAYDPPPTPDAAPDAASLRAAPTAHESSDDAVETSDRTQAAGPLATGDSPPQR